MKFNRVHKEINKLENVVKDLKAQGEQGKNCPNKTSQILSLKMIIT
jgi:hypothetical protein